MMLRTMATEHYTDTNPLFQLYFPTPVDGTKSPPLLALGMLQWGTTPIDNTIINGPRGILTEADAREIYQTFRTHGVVLFDTAEGYGGGTSEKSLGRLLQQETGNDSNDRQEKSGDGDTTVATTDTDITNTDGTTDSKNKHDHHDHNIIIMTKFLPSPWRWRHEHFERALCASNKRLGISATPIYLLHSPMHLYRDIEYWVESAAICKKKGFLTYFGLSNCSAEEVRRAVDAGKTHGVPVILNQVHYSLLDFNSDALHEMQRTCDELGVAVIGYNCLGQGMLTDKFTKEKFHGNKPAQMMRISWNELGPLRTALREIADAHSDAGEENKVSMAQVAMSWCRAKNTIPLVGCRSKQQAEDTLASLSLHLTSQEVAALDAVALNRCTLDSPAWRRKVFVVLAGVVMTVCRWLDHWGVGAERIQL